MTPLFNRLEKLLALPRESYMQTTKEVISDYGENRISIPAETIIRLNFFHLHEVIEYYGFADIDGKLVKVHISGEDALAVRVFEKTPDDSSASSRLFPAT